MKVPNSLCLKCKNCIITAYLNENEEYEDNDMVSIEMVCLLTGKNRFNLATEQCSKFVENISMYSIFLKLKKLLSQMCKFFGGK